MIDLATPIDTLPLFNFSHWTDEEIDAFIADDVLIEMKCIECGHIAKVPDWMLGEFAEENKALGKDGEVEIECPRCNGAMRRLK